MNSDLNRLIATFKGMEENGFDTSQLLKWNYFFLDKSKENLCELRNTLLNENFTIHEIIRIDSNLWRLIVSKNEILDADKFHERNLYLNDLAENNNVLYDGWEVEKMR